MSLTLERIETYVKEVVSTIKIPSSVYRIQFHKDFTFNSIIEYLQYLWDLGIDGIYCSPFFEAVKGSVHGYNVTNPTVLNPELGGEEAYDNFTSRARELGLKQIADIVPNHMGILGQQNQLWVDVLENGRSSRYADFFDIDWDPEVSELHNKVLIPILGGQFGVVLENGEIQLVFQEGEFHIQYWDHVYPVDPSCYAFVLEHFIGDFYKLTSLTRQEREEFLSIITAFKRLPPSTVTDSEDIEERYREKEIARKRLARLVAQCESVSRYINDLVTHFNGEKGRAESFDLLDHLLGMQNYRLASWRVASEEINYRRFFDINELAAIRNESYQVFEYYHKKLFSLMQNGCIQGVRIDHPDGLYDPPHYFHMLQVRYLAEMVTQRAEEELGELSFTDRRKIINVIEDEGYAANLPLYLVVEKILDRKEYLPENWQVHGTTGYDYLNALNGLFIDRKNEYEFEEIYRKFTGLDLEIEELLYEKKEFYARIHMPAEINMLALRLSRIAEKMRCYRDFTLNDITIAIRQVISCFPVYRTYISPNATSVSERDETFITISIERAKQRNPLLDSMIFNFIRDILLLKMDVGVTENDKKELREFVMRFQQITSPIMAKGLEDTAFYINNRFISLNEVGSDPAYFGYSPGEFHRINIHSAKTWPYTFITTSTHDTKRSGDVRMRLNVISEMPEEWRKHCKRWSRICKKYKTMVNGELIPDRNTEYFIYQTLIGIWPDYPMKDDAKRAFFERIWICIEKSIREAKTYTSWIHQNEEYEKAVKGFVEKLVCSKNNYFLKVFLPFKERIAAYGMLNSLAAVTVKLGSCGVFDCYQGTELWDYSLVDPDNRRPVDYDLRRHLLYRVRDLFFSDMTTEEKMFDLLSKRRDSRLKIFLLWRGLNLRRHNPELFLQGDYIALEVEGELRDHIVAFMRKYEETYAVIVVARFFTGLIEDEGSEVFPPEVWKETSVILGYDLDETGNRDILSGEEVPFHNDEGKLYLNLSECFRYLPFALITNDSTFK